MTATALNLQELTNHFADARIGDSLASARRGEKMGASRTFFTASFSYDGDPAYLSVANPPRRGPVFARAVGEGGLGEITKPIDAFFKGHKTEATHYNFNDTYVLAVQSLICGLGVHKSLANVVALTLAGILTLDQAKQLFASYKNLHLIRFVYDKANGQWEIADDSLLTERKAYKPRAKKGQEESPATVTPPVEEEDDDDLLLLAAGV